MIMSSSSEHMPTESTDQGSHKDIKRRTTHVVKRVQSGTPGKLMGRLNAADFMNSAFQFSALAVLCLFPFIIIVTAALGGDGRRVIVSRLGLSPQAAKVIDSLMSSGHQALATLNAIGIVFLLMSGIAIAGTLQAWYQKLFEVQPPSSWLRQMAVRSIWLATMVVNVAALSLVGLQTGPAGGRLLIFICEFVISLLFWWWSLYLLLYGRVGWRELFPAGLATALCLTGLGVVSALSFSDSIVSNQQKYGTIGAVMVLMSWCIGFGVVVHLGAVVGRMWNERAIGTSDEVN
jgi:membrane protein